MLNPQLDHISVHLNTLNVNTIDSGTFDLSSQIGFIYSWRLGKW